MPSFSYLHYAPVPLPFFLECGTAVYRPGDQHPNRANLGVFDLLLVEKGRLFIGEEETAWELAPGDMLILRPDRYHYSAAPCAEDTTFHWLHYQSAGSWTESEADPSQDAGFLPEPGDSREYHPEPSHVISVPKHWTLPVPSEGYELFGKLNAMSAEKRSHAFWERQLLFLRLLRLADEGQRMESLTPARIVAEQAEAYIKQHFREDVTNASIGEALHFHPNYITRCMKTVYQCTPMEFLQHYRLEQAKLLLLTTDLPVSAIADRSGFHYAAYFSRCFTDKIGVSPLQYRKRFHV
ncbi:helix-turn-helix transcriptional regulator [Paenibacillus sp. NPDC056579]|uniref:helix-turn-helix transcriptional regulator n=1 Tax=Paenibacillus sp. NPDC056579 TaxID=3345871 RepID=UPI0036C04FC0